MLKCRLSSQYSSSSSPARKFQPLSQPSSPHLRGRLHLTWFDREGTEFARWYSWGSKATPYNYNKDIAAHARAYFGDGLRVGDDIGAGRVDHFQQFIREFLQKPIYIVFPLKLDFLPIEGDDLIEVFRQV